MPIAAKAAKPPKPPKLPTNKLIINLIKAEFIKFDQIIKDSGSIKPIALDGGGVFFTEDSHENIPDWIKNFFGTVLAGKIKIFTASAKGTLLKKITVSGKDYIFAINFGLGRHLLNDDVIEERFGLKVVLNSVASDSLRSIDKTTLGSVPKQTREQMSKEGEVSNFGIDIEQDLINAVTGRSDDKRLGGIISGKDALALSVKTQISTIDDLLSVCVEKYNSTAYKTNFDWIDQIKDVRSTKKISELNDILLHKITVGDLEKIWMAAPEVLDWVDVEGFKFSAAKKSDVYPDLNIGDFLPLIAGQVITVDFLKQKSVYAVSSKKGEILDQWTAYKCFYAEVESNGEIFILNSGKWYGISKNFTDIVIKDFQDTPDSSLAPLPYESAVHANENAYNVALTSSLPGAHCLDFDLITHGGDHSKIEFCDVLTNDKRLLHIKRYSGSSQLSHLFAQGVVSAELFLQDESFRAKLNDKLPISLKLADVTNRPIASEYEVVYAVISKSTNPLDLPFFSKVSLRNARRRLLGYGYRVTKLKVVRV